MLEMIMSEHVVEFELIEVNGVQFKLVQLGA